MKTISDKSPLDWLICKSRCSKRITLLTFYTSHNIIMFIKINNIYKIIRKYFIHNINIYINIKITLRRQHEQKRLSFPRTYLCKQDFFLTIESKFLYQTCLISEFGSPFEQDFCLSILKRLHVSFVGAGHNLRTCGVNIISLL